MSADENQSTTKALKTDAQKLQETVEKMATDIPIKPAAKELNKRKSSPKLMTNDEMAIITLSDEDGHDQLGQGKKTKKKKRPCHILDSGESSTNVDDGEAPIKRLKLPIKGAPKYPNTGYILYLNGRRLEMRETHPTTLPTDMVRIVAAEWQQMTPAEKEVYLQQARKEKERYHAELDIFLKKNPGVMAMEKRFTGSKAAARKIMNTVVSNTNENNHKGVLKDKSNMRHSMDDKRDSSNSSTEKNNKRKRTPSANDAEDAAAATDGVLIAATPGEVPIFTSEFLEHNKHHDAGLRVLRKTKIDLDNKKAILQAHVQSIKDGVEKIIAENKELEEKNRLLEVYLTKLKQKLANAFASLPLPTEPNGANMENIDKYLNDLYKMATSNTHGPACLNKAKDIVRKLDLQISF